LREKCEEKKHETTSRRNIFALGFVSFFTDLSSEMVFSILPAFLLRLPGSSRAVLGLIEGTAEALSYGLICICYENTSFPELQQLGFSFYMAEDKNQADLEEKLLDAVDKMKTVEIPILEQSRLAVDVFGAGRERNEYLELLQ